MPAITIFDTAVTEVPEGSNHEYQCTLVDLGVPIQLAAITAVRFWLDDLETGVALNSRTNIDPIAGAIGVLSDAGGGVGAFLLKLTGADATIADATKVSEQHRLTLKFTYTRVGGGTGTLTHEVIYRVRNLARIP
jgi:hypothetical protein